MRGESRDPMLDALCHAFNFQSGFWEDEVEEHGIKSAIEIAMEKIAGIPELTPEEAIKQKEKEYRPLGEAIAKRYLEGSLREDEVSIELGKYPDDKGQIVRRAFASRLCQSIGIGDAKKSLRALEGVELISGRREYVDKVRRDLEGIVSQFEKESTQRFLVFQKAQTEKLKTLGIAGSAVKYNFKSTEDWRQEWNRIRQAYEPRLNQVRETLIKGL